MTVFSDTFTYSNGALSSVSSGAWIQGASGEDGKVASSVLVGDFNLNNDNSAFYNGNASGQTQFVEAAYVISSTPTSQYIGVGICLRGGTGPNYYFATPGNGDSGVLQLDFYKRVGGSFTAMGSGGYTLPSSSGTLRMEANGSTISVYVNGSLFASATDSALTGTRVGTVSYAQGSPTSTAVTLDNWSGGDITTGMSGTAANTLGALSSSASGSHITGITGTSARTLGAVTPSASGTHSAPTVTGTSTRTLGALTSTVSGQFGSNLSGTSAVALAAKTPTASGTHTPAAVTGTSTRTLAVFTSSATGTSLSPSTAAYPVSVTARKLVDQNGQIFLLKSFSSWAMAQNLTNAEITTAIEGTAAKGFTAVTVSPCGASYDAGWNRYLNIAGQSFFTGTALQSSFGAAWTSMDWVMTEATRLGLTVIVSIYTGFNNDQGFGNDLIAAGATNAYNYGRNLGARYCSYPNLMWHIGADSNFDYGTEPGPVLEAAFHGVYDAETTGGVAHHLIVSEPQNGRTAYSQFISQSYVYAKPTLNSVYHWNTDSVDEFDTVWNETGATTRAVWDCEPMYQGNPSTDNQQLRERNYTTFIRGGAGINYGDEDWWPFGKNGTYGGGVGAWTGVLTVASTIEAGYCWSVVDQYVRDSTWTPSTFIVTGSGTGDTKAAGGNSSTIALAYFPNSRTIAVDTSLIAGTSNVRLRWYDPTNNTFTSIALSEAQTSSRTVTHPGNNSAGAGDWLLVVDTGAPTISVGGSLTAIGVPTRQVNKPIGGSTTGTGALSRSTIHILFRSFAGSLTGTGALVRQVQKTLTGSNAPSGTLSRFSTAHLAGMLTGAGTVVKIVRKPYSAALTAVGTVTTYILGAAQPPMAWHRASYRFRNRRTYREK